MKILRIVSVLTLGGWILPVTCPATVIGTTTVEQPVNLGTRSDPTKIPLGRVPVISNHGYGIHQIIGAARPCPDGAMRWEGGSELDQNLASVFGISVEPEDGTQVPGKPVTLRLKPWKPPGYSPYTKDQVLAATVWCLVRSAGGSPETPLKVTVIAEGPDDKPLEEKYAGEYVTRRGQNEEEVQPIRIPGTMLEEDAKGIAWVTFPDVPRKEPITPVSPAMVIVQNRGDDDFGWYVVPAWGSGNDDGNVLKLGVSSMMTSHVVYPFHGTVEANAFVLDGGSQVGRRSFSVGDEDSSFRFLYPLVKPETLAAEILAMVIATLPTEDHPLKISIEHLPNDASTFEPFSNAPGWREKADEDRVLECEFVGDPTLKKLVKGSVPLVEMKGTRWIEPKSESDVAQQPVITELPGGPPSQATPKPDPETKPEENAKPDTPPEPQPQPQPQPQPETKPESN